MTEERSADVGRLALREEGEWWNAYLARPDTMEGAVLLGSLRVTIAQRDPKLAEAFKELMKTAITMAIRDAVGRGPDEWTERLAPENERSAQT